MTHRALTVVALVLALGCSSEETSLGPIRGTLQIEVLDTAVVVIEARESNTMRVTVTSDTSFGLLPAEAITADGLAEVMPETGDTLYTAKISVPPNPTGPCQSQPVSLALSLHRQGKNAAVLGGISAYCGADTWYGVPTKVLRLAGPLPLPSPK